MIKMVFVEIIDVLDVEVIDGGGWMLIFGFIENYVYFMLMGLFFSVMEVNFIWEDFGIYVIWMVEMYLM